MSTTLEKEEHISIDDAEDILPSEAKEIEVVCICIMG